MAKKEDVENTAKIVMGNLKLMGEAKKSCLVVEGSLDVRLLSKYISDDVYCCSVNTKKKSNDIFFGKLSETQEQDHESNKNTISTLINCIYNFPNVFDWPKGFISIPVFGMVDKDFDDYESYSKKNQLVATFTHDMETLLIATAGKKILSELPMYPVSKEEVENALKLAYQTALLRKAITKYNDSDRWENDKKEAEKFNGNNAEETGVMAPQIQQRWLKNRNRFTNYEAFAEGTTVNAVKAIDYILEWQNDEMLNSIRRRLRNGIFKFLGDAVNKDGSFKDTIWNNTLPVPDDFFDIVNGHDIISAMIYLSPELQTTCSIMNNNSFGKLEAALIDEYISDYYSCFSGNPTYDKLLSMNLVKEILI